MARVKMEICKDGELFDKLLIILSIYVFRKAIHSPLELGRRAKAILEIGRADWLESVGYETKVIEYVPPEVSPENLLILAVKKSHNK